MSKKTVLEIGEKYSLLTIIDYNGSIKNRPTYLCKCTCGKYKIIEARSIASGKTKSCGCLRSIIGQAHAGYPYKKYIGKRFDRLTVIEYDYDHLGHGNGAHLLCKCICGNKKVIEARKLNHNLVKSCGCKHKECKEKFKEKNRKKYAV
jgi:hypothetical protein